MSKTQATKNELGFAMLWVHHDVQRLRLDAAIQSYI